MDKTLEYYNRNVEQFVEGTVGVDFHATADRFLAWLENGAEVLDFGCGAGRDTKYFLEKGFRVDAIDGSRELCRAASEYTGIPVRQMLFRELSEEDRYGGIWACASVLHVPKNEMADVFRRMERALRGNGVLYVSFKYGTFEGERNGRYFTDFDENTFRDFLAAFPKFCVLEEWVSGDVRVGRGGEKWLNVILRKNA